MGSGPLHFPVLEGMRAAQGVAAVLSALDPGSALFVDDEAVRDGLVARGARQVRHLLTMRHHLREVRPAPAVPRLSIRAWQEDDAARLAPVLVAAYGPDHPDPVGGDLDAITESLRQGANADDPLMAMATQVAVVGGRPVGAAIVLLSTHVARFRGPWLMNLFRTPDPALPGVGVAMLTRAMEMLRDDGQSLLGLAVTSTNPARKVYERLGFEYDPEGWILELPAST
ncbi:MAG: GNAT family N-acetyltransferase [Mycobacteriales bacterium]